ncbi:hypothetical protein GLAREA_05807 [Glarea lozoyensis ATCC 20868]|uniref:Uncharacterized protein n=1 Tax=Glarea lozoyensis (strain ATCC 20868 / MF5171) TaxID=1116229 RepID=S3DH41_GLAL2|nr:uncharacterized protein GLAREA_05807 [Glarea lozoyensis ATCC 20868]EPE36469.1 hypothetical protein GLAREA_05807 [Glarea lozoyensis ATCC 20868]
MPLSQPVRGGQNTSGNSEQSRQTLRDIETMVQSSGVPQRLRNDGKHSTTSATSTPLISTESWVEISSQPSSSSLSSIGDEIVTTGLRVQHDPNSHRRRRAQGASTRIDMPTRQTSTSSQEEYEESESEEDHVMTSSNEHITPATRLLNMPQTQYDAASSDEDDDENATALGRRTDEPFTPQPNAFSHPPSSHRHRRSEPGSYFPARRNSNDRNPYASRRLPSYNQADHDAALRASLTTLLSIGAAAARGKRNQQNPSSTNIEPMGLRFVPESELVGPSTIPANTSRPLSPSTRARSSPSISSTEAVEKGKRKAGTSTTVKEKPRADKKRRKSTQVSVDGEEMLLSPTVFTWVVSAGVLVLFSVVGFGAGYVIGREVGRKEVLSGFQGASFSDSGYVQDVKASGGGLRRFKWGIGGGARGVAASA